MMDVITTAKQIFVSMVLAFHVESGTVIDQKEAFCMAQAVYFEARQESHSGKVAVANVIKNRKLSDRFPNTYCGVVNDGPKRESWKTKQHKDLPKHQRVYILKRNKCAFSFMCDGKPEILWTSYMDGTPIPGNETAWRDSINVTLDVMAGNLKDNTGGALHYANMNIADPYWANSMTVFAVIGNHTFFID
jgi:spore germination cell wall hydrolase CwlJ-like protein